MAGRRPPDWHMMVSHGAWSPVHPTKTLRIFSLKKLMEKLSMARSIPATKCSCAYTTAVQLTPAEEKKMDVKRLVSSRCLGTDTQRPTTNEPNDRPSVFAGAKRLHGTETEPAAGEHEH